MSTSSEQQRKESGAVDVAPQVDALDEDETPDEAQDRETARATSNADVRRSERRGEKSNTPRIPSSRFEGDSFIDEAKAGNQTFESGDYGGHILKVQMALIDLGYEIKDGASGVYDADTKRAVKKFQRKSGLPVTGKVDDETMEAIERKFDSRKPYIKAAKTSPDEADTHELTESEREQALEAMAPIPGGAASARHEVFVELVNGKSYGDRMKSRLNWVIGVDNQMLFVEQDAKRDDPDENLHDWSTLEAPAKHAKQVTDKLYAGWAPQKSATEISVRAGTLVDNWEDQSARMANQTPAENLAWAKEKVWYYITSDDGCAAINKLHHAKTGNPDERAILDPLVDELTNTADKVKQIVQTEIGWGGMQGDGMVKIQRFKADSADENRAQLWDLFHTCIHEYLHLLAHDDLWHFIGRLEAAGDASRAHTLIEGFCDFFTLNVRASLDIDHKLQRAVEGPYYKKGKRPPAIDPGLYGAHAEAERVVGVVGINNAMAAYFQGKTKLIGDT